VEIKGCNFIGLVFESVLKLTVKVCCTFEDFIECGLGDLFFFGGVEFFSSGEFVFAGIVEDDSFFFDVGKEVLALDEFVVDEFDVTGDYSNIGAQRQFSAFGFDFVPKADVSGGEFELGNNAYIVVALFVDSQAAFALLVRAVFPVSACVGAEQDYLMCIFRKVRGFYRQ